MLAYRLPEAQLPPEFQEVPEPDGGPVRWCKVAGSGRAIRLHRHRSRPSLLERQPPRSRSDTRSPDGSKSWEPECVGFRAWLRVAVDPSGRVADAATCAGREKRATASSRRRFALRESAMTRTRPTSSSPRPDFSSPSVTSSRSKRRRSPMRASRRTAPSSLPDHPRGDRRPGDDARPDRGDGRDRGVARRSDHRRAPRCVRVSVAERTGGWQRRGAFGAASENDAHEAMPAAPGSRTSAARP